MPGRIAIIGATGLVGNRLLAIAAADGIAAGDIGLYASAGSAGQQIAYGDSSLEVRDLASCDFSAYQGCLFCIGDELSAEFVPQALNAGCLVVDKSNAFRMAEGVPLVVAGVNDQAITGESQLAANPNCTTIVLCHAIAPLAGKYGLQAVWAASYQSVSGAGRQAAFDLLAETKGQLESFDGEPAAPAAATGIAFNVQPAIGRIDESGRCSEEAKLVNETRKILADHELSVVAHTVRVPVTVGHAIAVTVQLAADAELAEIARLWNSSPAVKYMDTGLPTPASASTHDRVEVGRLRREAGAPQFSFFVCGDNINIAAALNGWRIYQLLLRSNAR